MTLNNTLRTAIRALGVVCFVALCGTVLFVTVAGVAQPAGAQELPPAAADADDAPEIDFWIGQILPPPPAITIDRLLYADDAAGDAFDCASPSSVAVDSIETARWACYSIVNTGDTPVSTFTLTDAEMQPSHTYIPAEPGVDTITAGETVLHQIEVKAAFVADSDTSPIDYFSQRSLWDSLEIDDYQMVFAPSCFCFFAESSPPPYRITVLNGVIANAVSVETGNPAPMWSALTIDEMHERITTALDPADPSWQVSARLDTEHGVPTSWIIDEEIMMADEEFGGTITNFTQLFNAESPTGDVDCSGETNIIDALLVALYDAEITSDLEGCPSGGVAGVHASHGDVNGDGEPNIIDALLIARCSTGLHSMYCHSMPLADRG